MKKLGLLKSFAIYIPAAVILWLTTAFLIPFLSELTGLETIISWFIVAGIGVFGPMIVVSMFILKSEGYTFHKNTWSERLRFLRFNFHDLKWAMTGLILAGLLSRGIMKLIGYLFGTFDHTPAFMSFTPLDHGRYWILAAWFPYWILNIFGEELLWRGVMLPRQEAAFGKFTWIIHGSGWALFHIAFGWQLLAVLLPLIFIQSYVVQKTKNTWTGIIMHGGLNGPSFIAIALGWL